MLVALDFVDDFVEAKKFGAGEGGAYGDAEDAVRVDVLAGQE